jgi:hypothetical protein
VDYFLLAVTRPEYENGPLLSPGARRSTQPSPRLLPRKLMFNKKRPHLSRRVDVAILPDHPFRRFTLDRRFPARFQRRYTKRSPLGYGRPRRAIAWGLRLKQERRVIVPLSAEEVAKFWQSFRTFRTFRDLALVGLMLLSVHAPSASRGS